MIRFRLLKRGQKAEITARVQSLPARPQPKPSHLPEPGTNDVMRAAAQEFGTGLRARLGAGEDGICW